MKELRTRIEDAGYDWNKLILENSSRRSGEYAFLASFMFDNESEERLCLSYMPNPERQFDPEAENHLRPCHWFFESHIARNNPTSYRNYWRMMNASELTVSKHDGIYKIEAETRLPSNLTEPTPIIPNLELFKQRERTLFNYCIEMHNQGTPEKLTIKMMSDFILPFTGYSVSRLRKAQIIDIFQDIVGLYMSMDDGAYVAKNSRALALFPAQETNPTTILLDYCIDAGIDLCTQYTPDENGEQQALLSYIFVPREMTTE